MKGNSNGLFQNCVFSRREFLKYTGSAAGLYLAGRWLSYAPSAHADSRPRVVSVRDSNAPNWDYATGYHWEYINQDEVNNMVATGVMSLTGAANVLDAWNTLIPYQSGDAVVIKVNFNNAWSCGDTNNNIDAYPETVNAVIDGLTSIGVPANKIWITDPSRLIPDRFIAGIDNSDVQFYTSKGWGLCGGNSYQTNYVAAGSSDASPTTHPAGDLVRPAQVFADAAHLINIPLLKGHGAGHMTLGMKNHYGSVTFSGSSQDSERSRMHQYLEPALNPDHEKSILADICNNPHIKNKTRLILGDGLFGHPTTSWQSITKWQIFNDDDPNILFFGTDPIATDSVMCDYITEEQATTVIHSCLHHGAAMDLGIHDHWDGFESKQDASIDYINIDADKVNRFDLDRKIRDLKEGNATEEEIKELINRYMEAS